MLVRGKKAGNSEQCFSSRLGEENMVVCAAINPKEQAICLQKLQAVVITFLLFNFLEEYIIVKRTVQYWKCARVSPIFFKMRSQNVFI